MKKRICLVVGVVLMCAFLAGMGGMDDSKKPVSLPETVDNYSVTLVDQSNASMELKKFSCAGEVFFSGKKGEAQISISFEKILSISFFLKEEVINAEIKLHDGALVPLTVDGDEVCYGALSYGAAKLYIRDIKSITFHKK
ncbi:MAG: hypothetical protein V1753_08110 [Pseudomonadota bacterium]